MNRLRELRESQNLSLSSLGKLVNMSASVLGNYERENRHPNKETWQALANHFGVSVPYIMGIDTTKGENEITISKSEYERLKAIEQKYHAIQALVAD